MQPFLRLRYSHQFQQFDATSMNLFLSHFRMMRDQAFRNLVADGEHRGQCRERVLKHHRDVLPADGAHLLIGTSDELHAFHPDGAPDLGVVVEQPDQAQRGHRFARTGFAHDAERTSTP